MIPPPHNADGPKDGEDVFYGTTFEELVDAMDKEDRNLYPIKSNKIDYSDSETECESDSETESEDETEHQKKTARRCF